MSMKDEQEIKQLKEDKELVDSELKFYFKEACNLKEKLEKIKELIEKESDLDLHPDAEELQRNWAIKRILDKFKEILEEKK